MPRILLVDDDAQVRGVIRLMLEEAGLEVVEAKDGREAIREFRSHPIDLVLCDIYMPDKDGLEVIQELRREFPGVAIIAMSGAGHEGPIDVLAIAQRFGAAAVLYKPIGQADLLSAVLRLLGRSGGPG